MSLNKKPKLFIGGVHHDHRGALWHNNPLDVTAVKRLYMIQNADTNILRGWRGHFVEARWFSSVQGKFTIWATNLVEEEPRTFDKFNLDSSSFNVLYVPAGYATCLKAETPDARLLVMADYALGTTDDDHAFPLEHFGEFLNITTIDD